MNLEDDGDGARLCEALAACVDAGIGVTMLKVGSSEAGASADAAHTGAVAGDQRVFGALLAEAGAVPAADPHDLLELAKALALRRAPASRSRPGDEGGGLAMMTCSGGDSSAGADEAARLGVEFPPFAERTERRLRELVPPAATVANPLDYTAVIWGERERLRDIIATVANDPSIARLLIFYDEPELTGDPKLSWDTVREGILDELGPPGAASRSTSTVPSPIASRRRCAERSSFSVRRSSASAPKTSSA